MMIDGAEQGGAHNNISLEQLDEFMPPKAIDCLGLVWFILI